MIDKKWLTTYVSHYTDCPPESADKFINAKCLMLYIYSESISFSQLYKAFTVFQLVAWDFLVTKLYWFDSVWLTPVTIITLSTFRTLHGRDLNHFCWPWYCPLCLHACLFTEERCVGSVWSRKRKKVNVLVLATGAEWNHSEVSSCEFSGEDLTHSHY